MSRIARLHPSNVINSYMLPCLSSLYTRCGSSLMLSRYCGLILGKPNRVWWFACIAAVTTQESCLIKDSHAFGLSYSVHDTIRIPASDGATHA